MAMRLGLDCRAARPRKLAEGNCLISVILLDGAHDRTEVSLDLDVR